MRGGELLEPEMGEGGVVIAVFEVGVVIEADGVEDVVVVVVAVVSAVLFSAEPVGSGDILVTSTSSESSIGVPFSSVLPPAPPPSTRSLPWSTTAALQAAFWERQSV